MRLRKLIKEFAFTEAVRRRITLGAGARLVPGKHKLQLQPAALEGTIRTWTTTPKTLKKWLLFQAHVATPDGTTITYRLSDGAADLFCDGTEWRAAAAGEWNTEAEVCANIESFPVTTQTLAVVIRLTSDTTGVTPSVERLKVLWSSDVEWQEEYLIRSLIPAIREQVRPIAEVAMASAGSPNYDLKAIEAPYNITALDAVYNVTADPAKLAPLAATMNAQSVVTLSPAAPAGARVLIRFEVEPEVAIATSNDFYELSKVPGIIVENIVLESRRKIGRGEHVMNKETGQGWHLAEGHQEDIAFDLRWITASERDHQRLSDELKRFFETNKMLRARGQDELFSMVVEERYDQMTRPTNAGLHVGRLRARIAMAVFYERDANPVVGTLSFHITGGNLELDVDSP